MTTLHIDEARVAGGKLLLSFLDKIQSVERAVLIEDLFGKFRLVLWSDTLKDKVLERIKIIFAEKIGEYWSGDIWVSNSKNSPDSEVYNRAWEEAVQTSNPKYRILNRRRTRSYWNALTGQPPWNAPEKGPPIVVFYSFKGGVGRSTSLAAFALQRSREGERVVVIDFDLDAPGVGVLLESEESGEVPIQWGVVDFLLETPLIDLPLDEYFYVNRREPIVGSGEIYVFPAGVINHSYIENLSRIDFENSSGVSFSLTALLKKAHNEIKPNWILIDARTGLSDSTGILMSGIAHLYVLFGTSSRQSWEGLKYIVNRFGAERISANKSQIDCILVQAMVPQDSTAGEAAIEKFRDEASDIFSSEFYVEDPADTGEDEFWYIRDAVNDDSPSSPIPIRYNPRLAHFNSLIDVLEILLYDINYVALSERISNRFETEE